MCVFVCLLVRGQKRLSVTLELELTGSCKMPYVGVSNQGRVLCKRRKASTHYNLAITPVPKIQFILLLKLSIHSLCWLQWEMIPLGLHNWALCPQMVAVFGKVIVGGGRVVRGRTSLEGALKLHSLAPHCVHILCFLTANPASHSYVHVFSAMLACVSSGSVSRIKPILF